ncbi:hypothetical protein ACINK0_07110 [Deinococcus sp. VB343]|uniref:Uncharacterized protein n=1 Tax=Deinococcus sp. VB142 TaxID=3112952 RepID=A0AAU6Q6E7_9DEIO
MSDLPQDKEQQSTTIDVSDWVQDLKLPQVTQHPKLFTECLKSLPEQERLLAARNLDKAIAAGKVQALPVNGKPVVVRMLTERGKIESLKVRDYWITVDAAFGQWLSEQAVATVYHLIRLTGQPGLTNEDISSGRFELREIQRATQQFLSRQPARKPATDYQPKRRRRPQAAVTPDHESENRG